MQILKEGGLPPTVYRIPEVSLADVFKKEKIEENITFINVEHISITSRKDRYMSHYTSRL